MGKADDDRRRHRRKRDRLQRHGIFLAIVVFLLTQGWHLATITMLGYTVEINASRASRLETKLLNLEYVARNGAAGM